MILFKKTIIWPWGQRSRSHKGHYSTRHTALWSCIYELSVHEQFCWIYWNYLTLRSKVNISQRSLGYATHRLMVMHPHTNYHWPTSKDKNVMALTRKYYSKTIIWPLGQRSRSHKGHYGTRHTTLWSCTHIRNIIDLSRKTKKLWPGQASLRRSGSGRKNQD